MMEKMLKKIYGVLQVAFIGLLGCGICTAETRNDIGKVKPVAPCGVVNTASPTYEWKPVPGATRYCLTVSDLEGDIVYLAWYTAPEAACNDIGGKCAVSPSCIIEGRQWAVIACVDEKCSSWSEWTSFEFPQPVNERIHYREIGQQEADSTWVTASDG